MKADKNGLLIRDIGVNGKLLEHPDRETLRDLGGTTDFTRDESKYFMHIVGTQVSKASVIQKKKKKEEDDDE